MSVSVGRLGAYGCSIGGLGPTQNRLRNVFYKLRISENWISTSSKKSYHKEVIHIQIFENFIYITECIVRFDYILRFIFFCTTTVLFFIFRLFSKQKWVEHQCYIKRYAISDIFLFRFSSQIDIHHFSSKNKETVRINI